MNVFHKCWGFLVLNMEIYIFYIISPCFERSLYLIRYFHSNRTVLMPKFHSLDENHLDVVRGLKTKKFQRDGSTRRAQLSVVVTTVRLNGFSLLLCQDLNQCWLDKIRKALSSKSDPLSVVSVLQYCLRYKSGRLPRLVRRKESMLCSFYRWFF